MYKSLHKMSFRELLTLMVVIPLFLFLSVLYQPVWMLFFGLWIWGLCFDVYSTYCFYIEKPDEFGVTERNKIFCWFTERFGFKQAVILFVVVVEVSLLVFFTVLPLRLLCYYLFPLFLNCWFACFAAGFGVFAVGHLQAAIKNMYYNCRVCKNKIV